MTAQQDAPFGTQLRRYRASRRLTQEGLAERAGLSPRGIRALERGERTLPRQDTVDLLAEALALTPAEREEFQAASRAAAVPEVVTLEDAPLRVPSQRRAFRFRRQVRAIAAIAACAALAAAGVLVGGPVIRPAASTPLQGLGRPVVGWGRAADGTGRLSYPVAVAVSRNRDIYVLDHDESRVHRYASDGTPLESWGGAGAANGQFLAPAALAVGPSGEVYVADSGNNRIQVFSPSGAWKASWTGGASPSERLSAPSSVAVGPQGRVYVAEGPNNRIRVFSRSGMLIKIWSGQPLYYPDGIAVDRAGHIYATTRDYRLEELSPAGKLLKTWPNLGQSQHIVVGPHGDIWTVSDAHLVHILADGSAAGPDFGGVIQWPEDVALDARENIFVADAGGQVVEVFAPDGTLQEEVGRNAETMETVKSPSALATDRMRFVYAVDAGGRVVKYSPNGAMVATWSVPGMSTAPGPRGIAVDQQGRIYLVDGLVDRVWVLDSTGHTVVRWGRRGSGPGQLNIPAGIAVSSSGRVYVADSGNARIEIFSGGGQFLQSWSLSTVTAHSFIAPSPSGLALDAGGNVYVSDGILDTVMKLSPAGRLISTWGSAGNAPGHFRSPGGVALGRGGQVYIADTTNGRIQVLSSTGTVLQVISGLGGRRATFSRPSAVAVDSVGDVYVADTGHNRVLKFLPKQVGV